MAPPIFFLYTVKLRGFFRLLMKEIFGPYETLGSVSVVFADNQSDNKI